MTDISPSIFQKIHFVRIIDFDYINAGDIFSSPLMYTHSFFKDYSIITHNLSSVRYSHISKNDVVIIGGGGLLNYNPWFNFNVAINRILDLCDNVVLWGAGFNSSITSSGDLPEYKPAVDLSRFALCGLRDKGFKNYNFVPCASSMSPLLQLAHDQKPTKEIGTILREDAARDEKKFFLDGVENITHYKNYSEVINFISDHEYIVTSSYHGALWATLANRKVIVPAPLKFGFKYNYYGFKISFIGDMTDPKQLQDKMAAAENHPNLLGEYRKINLDFFEDVKELVRRTISIPDKSYEFFFQQNEAAEHYFKLKKK